MLPSKKSAENTNLPQISDGFKTADSDQEKSNLFNTFFTSITSSSTKSVQDCIEFTESHFKKLFDSGKLNIQSTLNFSKTNEQTVLKLIEGLDSSSGPGCAMISCKVIKASSRRLAPIITAMFNKSIENGVIPLDWKTAVVTPLYKNKGQAEDINNYRGISVIPPIAKIFEKILATQIVEHLERNCIVTNDQHGFRSAHSCETALHQILSRMNGALSKRQIALFLFIDFKKET
jgi:hypothetical protein